MSDVRTAPDPQPPPEQAPPGAHSRRKLLTGYAAVCAALLLLLAILSVATAVFGPLPLGPQCYFQAVEVHGGPRLALFNDREYGPYTGSIVELCGPQGEIVHEGRIGRPGPWSSWQVRGYGFMSQIYRDQAGNALETIRAADFPGIYYRYFKWPDALLWTLAVSIWYPLVLLSPGPAAWLILRLRRRRRTG